MGDVAIDAGHITALGKVDGRGAREIDADGHIVTPGFVDLHAHLDAQIGWDPTLTPVSWHGVTSVLIGNCGVTFAPCKPSDRELLAGMMETVEDIPKHAILTGLPWSWEDYGGYLDALETLQPGINVAGLVGHCAVRYYVMGERAVEEQATPDEVRRMAEIVGQSIDRGALGFSTNRYEPHKLPDGRSIPGTFADPSELLAIGKAVGARGGLMQAVGANGDVLKALAAQNRVLFSYGLGQNPGSVASSNLDALCAQGDITAITQVRGSGFMFGLQAALPFQGETWDALRGMNLAGRLAAIGNADTAAKLVDEAKTSRRWFSLNNVYFLGEGDRPDYTAPVASNVAQLCRDTGEDFAELFLRLARKTAGRGLFNLRMFNQDIDQLGELFRNAHIFPSLGDAGAHVSQIMDAGWSTFVLSYWIRDRGLYDLAEGVRRLTSGPARVMGLHDRGVLAVGKRADVNVIDLANVSERQPELVNDFPGGAPRFIQRARGYKATLVNGRVNVWNDEHTGERAGTVLRHGR
jgi:N-acyl-D-aspartate/D-glutamate deacylase